MKTPNTPVEPDNERAARKYIYSVMRGETNNFSYNNQCKEGKVGTNMMLSTLELRAWSPPRKWVPWLALIPMLGQPDPLKSTSHMYNVTHYITCQDTEISCWIVSYSVSNIIYICLNSNNIIIIKSNPFIWNKNSYNDKKKK